MEILKGRQVTYMKYTEYNKPREKVSAVFIELGSNYEEFETGAGNFSSAVIMFDDGSIGNVPIEDVRFDADVYRLIAGWRK